MRRIRRRKALVSIRSPFEEAGTDITRWIVIESEK